MVDQGAAAYSWILASATKEAVQEQPGSQGEED
jgi:hypothetical protein